MYIFETTKEAVYLFLQQEDHMMAMASVRALGLEDEGVMDSLSFATFCAVNTLSLYSLALFLDSMGAMSFKSMLDRGSTEEEEEEGWKRGETLAPATGALMSCGLGATSYTVTNLKVIFFFGEDGRRE